MDENFINISIDDKLYTDSECSIESSELINESKNIWDELNTEFIDKVVRLTIKVHIDGN